MAMVVTPTGQTIFVPDDFSGFAPQPLQVGTTEWGGALPQPQPPPPPPPPPVKQIGFGGGVVEETAGPVPEAQGMPSAFPGGVGAADAAFLAPTPNTAQGAAPMVPDATALAKQTGERVQANKQAQQAAAKDAAFRATAEGQIQTAGEQAAQGIERQQLAADKQAEVESAQQNELATVETEGLRRQDEERARADADRAARAAGLAEKRSQIDKLTKAELDYKIDDNRRWNNLSTGRKVLAGISVALSGLGDALMRKTGPNAALQIIQDSIQQDVAAQVREREQLGKRIGMARNSLDDYQRETGSMMEAHKLKVAEEYDRTAAQIRVTAAQYGSEAAKVRGEMMAGQLEVQAAGIREKTAEGVFNRDVQRQQLENQRRQTAIAGGHLALARQQFDFAKKQARSDMLLKLAKQAEEASAGGVAGNVKTVVDKDGKVTESVDLLKQPDGSVWKPSEKQRDSMIEERTGVQGLYDVMRQVSALRDKVGGASRKFSPTDQADYDQLVNQAVFAYGKANHLSTSDQESFNKIRDALFGADPSEYNISGVADRIEKTLKQADNNYFTHLQSAGYKGPRPRFVDVGGAPKAQTTPDEAAFQDLLKGVNDFHDGKRIQRELGGQLTAQPGSTEWNRQIGQAIGSSGGVFPSQLQTMRNIYSLATTSPDPKVRDQNLQFLTTAANEAPDKNVRELAQNFLDQVQAKGVAEMPTGAPQPGQRTVRDTVAAPPGQ